MARDFEWSRFPSSFALTQDAIDAGYKWNWPAVKNRANTKRGIYEKRARRFGPMNIGGDRNDELLAQSHEQILFKTERDRRVVVQ
jgi:hypothetical protein